MAKPISRMTKRRNIKQGGVPNTGGLLARIAATKAAKAAPAVRQSPFVTRAQQGKLPPKALSGAVPRNFTSRGSTKTVRAGSLKRKPMKGRSTRGR